MAGLLLTLANLPAPQVMGGLPLGLPPGASGQQIAYAEHLWATRCRLFGPHPADGTGDVEDFWEMAARLAAAVDAPAEEVWWRTHRGDCLLKGESASKLSVDERLALPAAHSEAILPYGPIPEGSSLWLRPEARFGDSYASWPLFREWARRPFAVGGVSTGSPESELSRIVASWVREGVVEEGEPVVVKAARAKHGLWQVPASASEEKSSAALSAAMGWTAVYMEGLAEAFIVQKFVKMQHEYRLFIVNGQLITGAGCVEEFTPLYQETAAFDVRTREDRAVRLSRGEEFDEWEETLTSSPVKERPALVRRYIAAGKCIAAGLSPAAVVVDLAYSPEQDAVLMVEANGLSNAGLYASKPALVAEALCRP